MLLLRTLRFLRWEQIAYRLVRIAQFRFYRAFPRLTSRWTGPQLPAPEIAPDAVEIIRSVFKNFFVHLNTPVDKHDQRLSDLISKRFTFLNRKLEINPIDWNRRYESHLWNYHLHYFDYALWSARDFAECGDERSMKPCRELIDSWIEQARVGRSDGWDVYPISLRVVNWIYAYSLLADRYNDGRFLERWRASIHSQLDFLSRHLEFHHLANHLLKNIKAMLLGGLFFNQKEWLSKSERLLWREFEEQVLDDGGHFERAPMYHAQVLTDFLECYALLKAFDRVTHRVEIESKLRAMSRFLKAMSYPDGTLALFNDSANTEETRPEPILEASRRIVGIDHKMFPSSFPQTGYYLWVSADAREKIIVDAGPPAAAYNPAHAHCDLLSYELWLEGRPFIVDSGVHGYGGDRFREYCRSTRAHNTVMFDGREQSEVWGTFRMARRAEMTGVEVESDEQTWSFRGKYRPFYNPRLVHQRHIHRECGGDWHIEDRMVSGFAERATSFIHLHPDVRVELDGHNGLAVECSTDQTKVRIEPFVAESLKIIGGDESPVQGWYFPDFGLAQPSKAICFEYRVRRGEPFGYRIKRDL
ncbi:MAG: heparinase II/III family protein [Acidobacteria bacterium]|nr:heparinase II/III family protein [Acidobacteriota bacterium]